MESQLLKSEFIASIVEGIEETLRDYKFNNYKKQIVARKLSEGFNWTYDESYVWRKALYLTSNAAILLNEGEAERLAIKALKECAEVYEYFYYMSEEYDKDYCLVLSSLCYDLAGYQANAYCLINRLRIYEFEASDATLDVTQDNFIINQIRQILLKNIPKANKLISQSLEADIGLRLFKRAVAEWYSNILTGVVTDFLGAIQKAYIYYLNLSNVTVSHLLHLLKTRLKVYTKRSVWVHLCQYDHIKNNPTWNKYIKLLTSDLYDHSKIKSLDKRISKFEFWTSQIRAIEKGLIDKEDSFVIQMPTSAGKTFIAEIAILNALTLNPGKRCIYIAPFRALTTEKENELSEYLSKLGYSISSLIGSYDIDEFQEMVLEDTDVLIATPEKIDLLLRLKPEYFSEVSLVVVDEGHIVGDISPRASLLEFLIIRLRIKLQSIKILFISAVMPATSAEDYSMWLTGKKDQVIRSLVFRDSSLTEEWEPTRKLIGWFYWDGNNGRINYQDVDIEDEDSRAKLDVFVPKVIHKKMFAETYPNGTTKYQTSASLAYRFSEEGNCLVFCAKVMDTQRVGEELYKILEKLDNTGASTPNHFQKNSETESYYFAQKWFGSDSQIAKCIGRGIGIHFGDIPEVVRNAVESDYRSGNLRVLISTNTVGQGLNFPIKNLIIHSTIISQNKSVSVRDFWNIVGRAGKETEGQVIFVGHTPTDRKAFTKYTNKTNIEPGLSMYINVLRQLIENRISEESYESFIQLLSEPYLLNLLAEEAVESDVNDIISKIINNSLFRVQALEMQIELEPIVKSFRSLIIQVREGATGKLLSAYGKTGFSLKSNKAISQFIELNKNELESIVKADDYPQLLLRILNLFDDANIAEIKSAKLDKIGVSPSKYFDLALAWINGAEVEELKSKFAQINTDLNRLNVLISDGFFYRYPWGVSSFITILTELLEIKKENLPEGIKNLASYIKYGVNNPTACLARSLGIKNRNIASLLAERSNTFTGRNFIKWLSSLNGNEIGNYQVNLYDARNILSVALKLSPYRYQDLRSSVQFYIKGIFYVKEWREASFNVKVGNNLSYARDENNEHDPFAIKICYGETEIGYIPREYSKFIAVEIDVNQTEYLVTVLSVKDLGSYQDVYVRMNKLETTLGPTTPRA